jgi:hypothetical protein
MGSAPSSQRIGGQVSAPHIFTLSGMAPQAGVQEPVAEQFQYGPQPTQLALHGLGKVAPWS